MFKTPLHAISEKLPPSPGKDTSREYFSIFLRRLTACPPFAVGDAIGMIVASLRSTRFSIFTPWLRVFPNSTRRDWSRPPHGNPDHPIRTLRLLTVRVIGPGGHPPVFFEPQDPPFRPIIRPDILSMAFIRVHPCSSIRHGCPPEQPYAFPGLAPLRPSEEASEKPVPQSVLGRLHPLRHPSWHHGGPGTARLRRVLHPTSQAILAALASGLRAGTPRRHRFRGHTRGPVVQPWT